MKKQSKLLSLLMALALLLSLLPTVALADSGYTVSLAASAESVAEGGAMDVTLSVSNSDPEVTTLGALYATMTYNTAYFTYDAAESVIAGYTVTDSETPGTLTISRVGDAFATGDLLTLRFTAGNSAGSGSFTLSSAKADAAAGTTYYYCVVTNTFNDQTAKATSAAAEVVVNEVSAGATFVVSSTSVSYSSLADAIAGAAATDTITLTGTYTLTAGVTIPDGTSIILKGSDASAEIIRDSSLTGAMITIGQSDSGTASALTLRDIIIDGGYDATDDEPVTASSAMIVLGMEAAPTLDIEEGTVLRNNYNASGAGGAVINSNNKYASMIMNGGLISGNYATIGGGVCFCKGTFTMNGGTISGNTATQRTIYNSSVSSGGGGLYLISVDATINGTISGNTAAAYGAAIFVYSTSLSSTTIGSSADISGSINLYYTFSATDSALLSVSGALSNTLYLEESSTDYPLSGTRPLASGSGYTLTESDLSKIVWAGPGVCDITLDPDNNRICISPVSYNLTFDVSNGSVYLDGSSEAVSSASVNSTLAHTFTVTPSEGYIVRAVYAGGSELTASLSGVYTLGIVTHDTAITVDIVSNVTATFDCPYSAAAYEGNFLLSSLQISFPGSFTFSVTAMSGYEVASVTASSGTVTDNGDGTYTLTSFTEDTAVTVTTSESATGGAAGSADLTICTAEELAAFRDSVNNGNPYEGQLIRLAADIDLTTCPKWTSIGTYSAPFKGIFDGDGHTVTLAIDYDENTDGSRTYLGLFGYAYGASFRNLTTTGGITAAGCDYVGAIAADAPESNFFNCRNLADISFSGSLNKLGGIVGGNSNSTDVTNVGLYSCLNAGNITGECSSNCGGLAGYTVNMFNCANMGDITLNNDPSCMGAGGLAGGGSVISCCCNTGNVTSQGLQVSGLTTGDTIINCCNTGNVTNSRVSNRGSFVVMGGIAATYSPSTTLTNCYNSGTISAAGGGGYTYVGQTAPVATITMTPYGGMPETHTYSPVFVNCYGSTGTFTASDLGAAFKEDVNNINGGYPLLFWQSDTVPDTEYDVTLSVNLAGAAVHVYADEARTEEIAAAGNVYSLKMGQYFYTVSADGCVTEKSSFKVTFKDKMIAVTLRPAANVTFTVTPASATFSLTNSSGTEVTPVSGANGVYAYILYTGDAYTYTATADGYNGTTHEYIAADGGSITVNLTESGQSGDNQTITGGNTVIFGGTYNLKEDATGIITISTAEPVTLIGTGISTEDVYKNLYIDCTAAGVKLTLQDIFISNTAAPTNTIDFMGTGNYLYFAGTCVVDQDTNATGYAMIHVGPTADLTIGGVTEDDTLYFYKREQGAGIGGNGAEVSGTGEYNGAITITQGHIFGKGSKQGAVIGSGSAATASAGNPGPITINGGVLNLIANARGALIGGSAGSTGGASGANVYVNGGTLTLNIDYSGAAIGGGGYDAGNDTSGGNMYYTAGSIRTFIDYNAIDPGGDGNDEGCTGDNLWLSYGVTGYGVSDAAITANRLNAAGDNVYLLAFDTTELAVSGGPFTVLDGEDTVYSGGLHEYCYVNESLFKYDQIAISYTVDNWAPLEDSNLYLYLTGEDHTLTVNGETFDVVWDEETSTFTVTAAGGDTTGLQGDINSDGVVDMADLSLLLSKYGTTGTASDINSDGIVDMADLSLLLSKYGSTTAS